MTDVTSVSAEQADFPVVDRGYDREAVDRFRSDVARALAAYEVELGMIEPQPDPNEVTVQAGAAQAATILQAALDRFAEMADAADERAGAATQSEEDVKERLIRLRSVLERSELELRAALTVAATELGAARALINAAVGGEGEDVEPLRDVVGMQDNDGTAGGSRGESTIVVDVRDAAPVPGSDDDPLGANERRLAAWRDRLETDDDPI